jgi:hypothetical protein
VDNNYMDLGMSKSGFIHTLPSGRLTLIAVAVLPAGIPTPTASSSLSSPATPASSYCAYPSFSPEVFAPPAYPRAAPSASAVGALFPPFPTGDVV